MNWLRDAFDGGVTETSVRDTAHRTRNSAVSKPLALSDLDDFGMRSIVRSWLHYKSGIESSDHMLTEGQEADLLARLRGQSDDPQMQRRNWRPLLAMMFAEVMANSPASTQTLAQRDLFGLVSDAFEAEQKAYWKKSADSPLKPATLPDTALNIACIATMIGQIDATSLIDGLEQVGVDIDALNEFYGDLSGEAGDLACFALGYSPVGRDTEETVFIGREPDLLGEYMVLWALKNLASKQHARRATLRAKTLIEHASLLAPDMLLGFLIRLGQDFKGHVATHALLAQPWAEGTGKGIDPNLAAYFGLNAVLRQLLEDDGNLQKQHENGAFPLLFAAQEGHLGCVAALLEKGAAVNAINKKTGTFPLLMAAQNGHTEIVAALLEKGAAVNAINKKTGAFPLLMAAQEGHTEIVAALLEKGAAVNAINDKNGTFPLLICGQNGAP